MTELIITQALKPCPFCGGKQIWRKHDDDNWLSCHNPDCDCYGPRGGEEAWNQRSPIGRQSSGVATDVAGLSPTVEPVPVSPPDGASIPNADDLGPEATRLWKRMQAKRVKNFHVDWGSEAEGMTGEERAAALNRIFDEVDHPLTGLAGSLEGEAFLIGDTVMCTRGRSRLAGGQFVPEPVSAEEDALLRSLEGAAATLKKAGKRLREIAAAQVDGHPQGGDGTAPFMTSAVGTEGTDAPNPMSRGQRLEEVGEALKPFADLADFLDEQPDPRWQNPHDEVQVHEFAYSIGVGELHAAREAYRALSAIRKEARVPEWRCVNCKTVVAGHLKPDRCPECNWCVGFAEVAPPLYPLALRMSLPSGLLTRLCTPRFQAVPKSGSGFRKKTPSLQVKPPAT